MGTPTGMTEEWVAEAATASTHLCVTVTGQAQLFRVLCIYRGVSGCFHGWAKPTLSTWKRIVL